MATVEASPTTRQFVAAVRDCARERGIELQQVAKLAKMSQSSFSQKLSGKHAITMTTADRIAEALETTVADLLRRAERLG